MIGPGLLLASFALAAQAPPANANERRAAEVFERTKITRATYSLYLWNWIRDPDGSVRREWGAEFHSGSRHRVETPTVRVVADCAAQDGVLVDLARNRRMTGAVVAQLACGINTARQARQVTWLGRFRSRYGAVERLLVLDDEDERVYVVDRRGILVASEVFGRSGDWCLQAEPLAVLGTIPDGDLFSEASLARSFVAERYRSGPAAPDGGLWRRGRRCLSDRD
ncbi:MAG TPA: hypothetical protein VGB08_05115 [Allosphingosinicella sp.]